MAAKGDCLFVAVSSQLPVTPPKAPREREQAVAAVWDSGNFRLAGAAVGTGPGKGLSVAQERGQFYEEASEMKRKIQPQGEFRTQRTETKWI